MKILIMILAFLKMLFGNVNATTPVEQPKKDMFTDPRITIIPSDEEIDYDSIIDDWDDDEE